MAEPFDCRKDFIGGFNPSIRFWVGIVMLDEGMDVSLELDCRSMDIALQLFACQLSKPALYLIDP